MIYSINEGFFNSNKPNKVIIADIKAAEERIKSLIKYFADNLKIISEMKSIVCKDNFTDTDYEKIKASMQKLSDLETDFFQDKESRKLTTAVMNMIKINCRKSVEELNFSEDTPEDYRALVKKVSSYGEYTKSITTIANKFLKLNDDYTAMYNKRTELSSTHNKACDEFGGMVGLMIGTIPVIKLGFGRA